MTTTFNPPRIQNDETLYSYLARCHFLWGQTNPRLTSLDWFGRKGVCLNQCLPTEVSSIAKHADYPVDYLLSKHTYLPLFAAMNVDGGDLKQAMLGRGGLGLANASGISQLGKAELTNSKFCPECFIADIEKVGVGYWHLIHQFPGVKSCHAHGCRLVERKLNPRAYELPVLSNTESAIQAPAIQTSFAGYVAKLTSEASVGKLASTPFWEENALSINGQFRHGSHIDMQGLLFLIQSIEAGLELPEVLNEHCVRNILKDGSHNAHPLKKLLLRFVIDFIPASHLALVERETTYLERTKREVRCLNLLHEYRFSMREISRRENVSVGFIKVLAKRNSITLDERRQFITADIERKVIRLAIEGDDRKEIADQFGISVGAVEQIIQSVNGLSVWRQFLRMLDKRELARHELLQAVKANPSRSRKAIRQDVSRAYMWLYKYDRSWLYEALPPVSKRKYFGDNLWLRRDIELFPKLKMFLGTTLRSTGHIPTKYKVDKAFGGHGWFDRALRKLPKCNCYYRKLRNKFNYAITGDDDD
jgi:predicted DNA-binding protein YlxM (UPF0122 family)